MTNTKQSGKTITTYMEKLLSGGGADQECLNWLLGLGTSDTRKVLEIGLQQGKYTHLAHVMSYLMTHMQRIEWAIYCAESCIGIFEAEYPYESRPRKAIKSAKAYLLNPCEETRKNAEVAVNAVYAAYISNAVAFAKSVSNAPLYAENASLHAARACSAADEADHMSECAVVNAMYQAVYALIYSGTTGSAAEAYENILSKGYEILIKE